MPADRLPAPRTLRQRWCPQWGERWLVALLVGTFFGWVTAANAVSLTSEAVRFELVDSGGTGEALLGSVLLLLGGVLAAMVVLRGRAGLLQSYLAYAATVLWALTGVVVNQYAASILTTTAAVFSAALVLLALFGALRRGQARQGTSHTIRPGAA